MVTVNGTFVHYSEMPADAMEFLVHVFEVSMCAFVQAVLGSLPTF